MFAFSNKEYFKTWELRLVRIPWVFPKDIVELRAALF